MATRSLVVGRVWAWEAGAFGPYLCFHCVLCFVFYVFWPSWAESVFCVLSFGSLERSLCFEFTCFGPRSGANCLILK